MKLAPKDDPGGDKAGEVPLDVFLKVLSENDVGVSELGGNLVQMSCGGTIEVQCLPDPVNGLMVKRIAKKFDIFITDFYYDPACGGKHRFRTLH